MKRLTALLLTLAVAGASCSSSDAGIAEVGSAVAEPESPAATTTTAPETAAAEADSASSASEAVAASYKIEVWADNWSAVYVNGELVGEDSVPITTERSFNAETFTFEASYPFTVAIEAKDFKETDSGIEYIGQGKQQMGDGGIIAQVTNTETGEVVAVTDGSWTSLVVHQAPLNKECEKDADPDATCEFLIIDTPESWTEVGFDDSAWTSATEWSESAVSPKDGYDEISWDSAAQLIWGADLETDNTVLLRTTVSGAEQDQDQDHGHEAIDACLGRDVAFAAYAEVLEMSCDQEYLYIETDNLADHEMMVGITAWNGQVPLPHVFYGENSWAIPLNPVYNESTTQTPGQGPIAVAINGVMIFNPTQQSGIYSLQTDPNLIGELDVCGGHSGRGDDYHYHVAPTCLEGEAAGVVAYALDGFPVYGNSAIPDGAELDECGGLGTSADDYRYFANEEFPYVNGCFRGDFDMGLQPHAPGIRDVEPGSPKEIEITALYTDEDGWSHMEYLTDGTTASVNYTANGDNCFDFEFVDDVSNGTVRKSETYCRR